MLRLQLGYTHSMLLHEYYKNNKINSNNNVKLIDIKINIKTCNGSIEISTDVKHTKAPCDLCTLILY